MATHQDAEQRYAAQASLYVRRARQAALNNGQTLVEVDNGQLVRISPSGETSILKKMPADHKFPMGTKLKVT